MADRRAHPTGDPLDILEVIATDGTLTDAEIRDQVDTLIGAGYDQKAASDRAWIPFGRGPHMCIGFALAQMELVLMIARFAQRLDLTPTADVVPRPVGMVVNRPLGGAPFHIHQP